MGQTFIILYVNASDTSKRYLDISSHSFSFYPFLHFFPFYGDSELVSSRLLVSDANYHKRPGPYQYIQETCTPGGGGGGGLECKKKVGMLVDRGSRIF